MLNCAVWAILLFVASCMIADDARSVRHYCSIMSCNHLIAGAVSIPFIFFNFYFPEIRSSRSTTSVVKKKKMSDEIFVGQISHHPFLFVPEFFSKKIFFYKLYFRWTRFCM